MVHSKTLSAVYVKISGRVQGVGFRFFAADKAQVLGLKGWVRNTPFGDVEAEAEGPKEDLENWVSDLRQGPPVARVENIQVDWRPAAARFSDFSIR